MRVERECGRCKHFGREGESRFGAEQPKFSSCYVLSTLRTERVRSFSANSGGTTEHASSCMDGVLFFVFVNKLKEIDL